MLIDARIGEEQRKRERRKRKKQGADPSPSVPEFIPNLGIRCERISTLWKKQQGKDEYKERTQLGLIT